MLQRITLNMLFFFCLSTIMFVEEIPRNAYFRWWVANAPFKKITLAVVEHELKSQNPRAMCDIFPSSSLISHKVLFIPAAPSLSVWPRLQHKALSFLSLTIPPKRPPTCLTQETWLQTTKTILGNQGIDWILPGAWWIHAPYPGRRAWLD